MKIRRVILLASAFVMGLLFILNGSDGPSAAQQDGSGPVVHVLEVDGTINPALSDYIIKGIEKAVADKAALVIIRMDTPGGIVSTTKTIIKHMTNARIPVAVYVAPSGSSASSAGALITMSADVAAMAPGTNIGAAHPVGGGGEDISGVMAEKVINDISAYMRSIVAKKGRNVEWVEKAIRESVSITDKEAKEINVIDVVADSIPDLLTKLDGRKIEKEGITYTLATKGARVERVDRGLRFKILDIIANPNIAYILLLVGGLCIMMEIYNPGMIFPIVVGSMCLLLAAFAMQVLPVNLVGILLIIFSVILFVLELKVTSYGLLAIGAIISLTLGSVMLFDTGESVMRVSWLVIIPMVATVSAFFIFALGLVVRAHMKKPRTGGEGLAGEVGIALTDLANEGKVSVHGEYWNARADSFIPKGEKVRVIRMDGLSLAVTRHVSP
jgi:membrane-bound serine protease (ClpP class)